MEIRAALKSQYHASLAMLRQTIERCPDNLWLGGTAERPNWRVAYHTLFYTHLYLQPDEGTFARWEHHREGGEDLWSADNPSNAIPCTKEELLSYWAFCDSMIDGAVDALDLDAPTSGFHWYPIPKLDHQLVNIRHIQQHAGQLSETLMAAGIDTDWVGSRR